MKEPRINHVYAVTHPTTGKIFTDNAEGTHSTLRIEQRLMGYGDNYGNKRIVTAYLRIPIEDKEFMAEDALFDPNTQSKKPWVNVGMENYDPEKHVFEPKRVVFDPFTPGIIQVQESFDPYYAKADGTLQDPKWNPSTQENVVELDEVTGELREVYRNVIFNQTPGATAKVRTELIPDQDAGKYKHRNVVVAAPTREMAADSGEKMVIEPHTPEGPDSELKS